MKYVITESQYDFLMEQVIPTSIKRRANKETLEKYVLQSKRNYPPFCQEHEDGYDYADAVIDDAIDYFLVGIGPEIEEINEYSDIVDYIRMMCRDLFGEHLVYHYEENCIPEES